MVKVFPEEKQLSQDANLNKSKPIPQAQALSKQKMTAAAHDGCTSLLSRERCPSRYILGSSHTDLAKMLVVCCCTNHGGSFSRTTRSTAHAIAAIKETFLALKATWNSWCGSQDTVDVHPFSYTMGQCGGRKEMLLTRDYHCSETGSQQAGSLPHYFQLQHQTPRNHFVAQHPLLKDGSATVWLSAWKEKQHWHNQQFHFLQPQQIFWAMCNGGISSAIWTAGWIHLCFKWPSLHFVSTARNQDRCHHMQFYSNIMQAREEAKHQNIKTSPWALQRERKVGDTKGNCTSATNKKANYAPIATWHTNLQQIMFLKAHYIKQTHRKNRRYSSLS